MLIVADKLNETKKYHTVGTIPKSNITIIERSKMDTNTWPLI
jgi:hypothetical protein